MGQTNRKDKEQVELPGDRPVAPSPLPWQKPAGLSRRGWAVVAGFILLANLPVLHYLLLRGAPEATVTLPYQDDFSSPERLAANYFTTGGLWRLSGGELLSPGVRNNPLWLKARLPQNVVVEFDVRSQSPEGDIKVEIFGDGTDHASGYILIHGGWNNTISVIARLDEHGRMREEANPFRVQVGKTYHWRIERSGSLLKWSIDGQPFMSFDDPIPLAGEGHDRFGFSSWEADLYFDNLRIEPL